MSLDYGTGSVAYRGFVPTGSPLIWDGDSALPGSYISSHYDFLALLMMLTVESLAGSSHVVKLQVSDETGADFGTWTTIASIPLVGGEAINGCTYQARVPENMALVSVSSIDSPGRGGPRRALRVLHSGLTDATLSYSVEVYTTSRHE